MCLSATTHNIRVKFLFVLVGSYQLNNSIKRARKFGTPLGFFDDNLFEKMTARVMCHYRMTGRRYWHMIWDNKKKITSSCFIRPVYYIGYVFKARDIFYFVGQNQIHFDHLLTVYCTHRWHHFGLYRSFFSCLVFFWVSRRHVLIVGCLYEY